VCPSRHPNLDPEHTSPKDVIDDKSLSLRGYMSTLEEERELFSKPFLDILFVGHIPRSGFVTCRNFEDDSIDVRNACFIDGINIGTTSC
jgi:hypothetical protein